MAIRATEGGITSQLLKRNESPYLSAHYPAGVPDPNSLASSVLSNYQGQNPGQTHKADHLGPFGGISLPCMVHDAWLHVTTLDKCPDS